MTLLFTVIVVALVFEERDLLALHGPSYRDYQRRVPKLLPFSPRVSDSRPSSRVRSTMP